MSRALPFTIDRTSRTSLTAQLTAGFASAIRCGVYRKGETLPTIAEISRLSGVSQIVTRHAIAKLADAGLVVTRQFHGIEVLGVNSPPRKGHVLVVTSELRDTFFVASVSAVLRKTLTAAGYITTPVSAVRSAIDESRMDFSQLDAMLDIPIRLAVVLLDRWGIGSHIVASGKTPVVVFGSSPVKGAEGFIRFSDAQAKADFAAHCAAAGIRSVMEIVMTYGSPRCDSLLRKAGIGYEVWNIESAEADDAIEMVQRGAMEAFERRLSSGRDWLPDLLFFGDDYSAAGALTALTHHGVRIPEDVRLVSLAHVGMGPFFWAPLTRLELDPFAAGRSVADFVLQALAGKPIPADATVRATYCVGATFPQ